jgi:hypothetical protein
MWMTTPSVPPETSTAALGLYNPASDLFSQVAPVEMVQLAQGNPGETRKWKLSTI